MKTGQVSGGTAPSGPVAEESGNASSSKNKKPSGKGKLSLGVEQIEARSKDREREREEHWRSAPSPSSKVGGQVVERSGVMSAPNGTAEMGTAYKSPEKTRQSEKHNRSAAASRDERSNRAEGATKTTSPPRHAEQAGASAAHSVAASDTSEEEVSYQKVLPGGELVEAPAKPRSPATVSSAAGKTRSGEGTGKSTAAVQAQTSVGMGYASILPLSAAVTPFASSPKSPSATSTDAFAARGLSSTSHEEEASVSPVYERVLPGGDLIRSEGRTHSPSKSGKPGKTLSGEGSEKSSALASTSTSTSRNPAGAVQGSSRPGIIVPSGEPPPYAFASGSGQRPRTHSAGASESARLSTAKHQAGGQGGAASSAGARTGATTTAARSATATTTAAATTTTATTTATTRTTGASSRQAMPGSYLSLSPPLKSQAETVPPLLDLGNKKGPKSRGQQRHGSPSTASRTSTTHSTTYSTTNSSWTGGEDSSTISLSTSTFLKPALGGSTSRRGKDRTGAGEALSRSAVASGKSQARRSSLDDTSSSSRSSERSSEKAVPGMRKAKSYTKPGDGRRDDTSRSGASSGSLSRSANLALTSSSSGKGRGAAESTAAKGSSKSTPPPPIYRSKEDAAPWRATGTSALAKYDIQKAIEAPDTLDKNRYGPLPWERRLTTRPECDIEQEMWDPETVIEDEEDGLLNDRLRFQAKRLWVIRPLKDQLVDAVYQTDRDAFAATLATLHERAIAYGQEYQMPHPWGLESTLSKVIQEIVTDPYVPASALRWLTTQLAAKAPPEHLPVPWEGTLANVFKAAYAEKTPGKYTEQFNALHEHCWRVGGDRADYYLVLEMKSLADQLPWQKGRDRGFAHDDEFELQLIRSSPLCMAMWRKILSVPRVFMQECTPGGNKQSTAMAAKTAQNLLMAVSYDRPHLSQSQFHDYVMLACQHDKMRFVDNLVCFPEIRPGSGMIPRYMDVETANARTRETRTQIETAAKEFGATKILTYLAHWAGIVPYRVRGDTGPKPAILDTLFGPTQILPAGALDKKPDRHHSPTAT